MDETDLIKLPILGRYKECALNDKKIEKTWFKQLLTVKAIHYYFKNILDINVYQYRSRCMISTDDKSESSILQIP